MLDGDGPIEVYGYERAAWPELEPLLERARGRRLIVRTLLPDLAHDDDIRNYLDFELRFRVLVPPGDQALSAAMPVPIEDVFAGLRNLKAFAIPFESGPARDGCLGSFPGSDHPRPPR